MSTLEKFVSDNKTILMVIGLLIVAYLLYGWWQGYKVNVNVDTTRTRQQPQMGYIAAQGYQEGQ